MAEVDRFKVSSNTYLTRDSEARTSIEDLEDSKQDIITPVSPLC